MNVYLTITNVGHLILLQKALAFIKYGTDDIDARHMAASPYSGELMLQINEVMHSYYESRGVRHSVEYGQIEDFPYLLEAVQKHKSTIDDWDVYDGETKRAVIKTLCFPYAVHNETIDMLI